MSASDEKTGCSLSRTSGSGADFELSVWWSLFCLVVSHSLAFLANECQAWGPEKLNSTQRNAKRGRDGTGATRRTRKLSLYLSTSGARRSSATTTTAAKATIAIDADAHTSVRAFGSSNQINALAYDFPLVTFSRGSNIKLQLVANEQKEANQIKMPTRSLALFNSCACWPLVSSTLTNQHTNQKRGSSLAIVLRRLAAMTILSLFFHQTKQSD